MNISFSAIDWLLRREEVFGYNPKKKKQYKKLFQITSILFIANSPLQSSSLKYFCDQTSFWIIHPHSYKSFLITTQKQQEMLTLFSVESNIVNYTSIIYLEHVKAHNDRTKKHEKKYRFFYQFHFSI